MSHDLRLTGRTQQILGALVAHPARDHHGVGLRAETGLATGRIYPLLARLEALQWLDSGWEPAAEQIQGWPPAALRPAEPAGAGADSRRIGQRRRRESNERRPTPADR